MISILKNKKVKKIDIEYINESKNQPRQNFNEDELKELSESILQNGVLQPITVRRLSLNKYELISGERRIRASKMAGLKNIPCIIMNCDDTQAAVYSLMENLQRVDLDPFEEAMGIKKLIKIYGLTQEQVAKKLGKTQSTVANKIRLLKLKDDEIEMIRTANLTERHARAIIRIKDSDIRKLVIKKVINKNLNVSQTESLVEKIIEEYEEKNKKNRKTVVIKDVRIFINTIGKAIELMKASGIEATATQSETEEYIKYMVMIPKNSNSH